MPLGGVEVEGLIAFESGGDGVKDALPVGFHFMKEDFWGRENSRTQELSDGGQKMRDCSCDGPPLLDAVLG